MVHIQRGGRKTILCGLVMCLCLCLFLTSVVPIAFADDNETAFEAMWGTDKDNLTGSGTLAEAIAAVNATGSTIQYIRLNKSWTQTGTGDYSINGGDFTFDLNGQTVSSPMRIWVKSGNATFTDSVGGGQWECTHSKGYAVTVQDATATFTGGSYKGKGVVQVSEGGIAEINGGTFESTGDYVVSAGSTGAKLTIEGGSFTGGNWTSVGSTGTTTIKGGTFAAGMLGHIAYWNATLDLSGYPITATTGTTPITELTVNNRKGEAVTVDPNLKLPEGYSFYNSDDTNKVTVTELASRTKYAIKSADIVSADISWTSTTFTYSDGMWDPTTHTYVGEGWSTKDGDCSITVENTGTLPITANFAFGCTRIELYGGLDKRGFDLDVGERDTSTLSIFSCQLEPGRTGNPLEALDGDQIGSFYVSIAQKAESRQGWLTEDESTYFFINGEKATGLQKIQGAGYPSWYYFDPDTGAMQTGLISGIPGYENQWFYFDVVKGYMQFGFINTIPGHENQWFYFDSDTGVMQTGWQEIWGLDGKPYWYYFYEDGHMAANEYVPGTEIWVGSDGKSTTNPNE